MLLEKLNDSVVDNKPLGFTRRDASLAPISGKVHTVIGMRRAGKTTFLRQLQAERRRSLLPEQAIFVSFDDDRLMDLPVKQLSLLLEEYYRRFPEIRRRKTVYWYLDEIQLVSDWERFVRRVVDSENLEIVVSGSSARLLSRELHTSLRGRSIETIIRPFSFREFLRHRNEEPAKPLPELAAPERSLIEKRFLEYLQHGGFPEAQGLSPSLRIQLLQGYVDTVLFRDIIERYGVTQVAALRWLVRQCLRNPAGSFTVHRFHQDLKAQGLGVSKDALHEMFAHLTDAFLISAVPLSTSSERKRNSNPRKVYPIDPGLVGAFSVGTASQTGHALETVVMGKLERRGATVTYVKTHSGFEVDFHARFRDGKEELIQVCADLADEETRERELRALHEAGREHQGAVMHLLLLDRHQATDVNSNDILAQPVDEWLLETA